MEGTVGRCFATSTPDWGRDAGRGIGSLLIQPRSVYGYARILIELAGHSETIENTKHSIRIRLKGQLAWLARFCRWSILLSSHGCGIFSKPKSPPGAFRHRHSQVATDTIDYVPPAAPRATSHATVRAMGAKL